MSGQEPSEVPVLPNLRWPMRDEFDTVGFPHEQLPSTHADLKSLDTAKHAAKMNLAALSAQAKKADPRLIAALDRLLADWPETDGLVRIKDCWLSGPAETGTKPVGVHRQGRAIDLELDKPAQTADGLKLLGERAIKAGFDSVTVYAVAEKMHVHAAVRRRALDRLEERPSITEYNQWAKMLEESGWQRFHLNAFKPAKFHPNVVFTGTELAARVNVVPRINDNDDDSPTPFSLGDLLVQTAWSRQLSIRPVFASPLDHRNARATLWFNHQPVRHMPFAALLPPTVATLETALNRYDAPFAFPAETAAAPAPAREELKPLLGRILGRYPGVGMDLHPHTAVQVIAYEPPAGSTLVQILDGLALRTGSLWDWYGDSIVMVPAGSPIG